MNIENLIESFIKEDDVVTGGSGQNSEKETLKFLRAIKFLLKIVEHAIMSGDYSKAVDALNRLTQACDYAKRALSEHPKLRENNEL